MRAPAVCVLLVACANGARDLPPPDAPGTGHDAPGGGSDTDDAPTASCMPHALPNLVPEQWNWVPVPGSACGNGSQAGFEINPTTRSKEVVIYLMGGGGCYSAQTCGGPMPLAANLDGYGPATFATEISWFGAGSIFDRATSPVRDATWIYVPYCTGDFHSGSTVAPYGTHHVGYANLSAYLAELAPAYCDASRIVLAGSSAGGFGTVFNYEHVQGAFPATPIDLVDDSGPPLRQITAQWQSTLRSAWGQVANIPAGCTGCDQSWTAYVPFLSAAHPARRFSLISSLQDYSIGTYFGFNPYTYEAAVNDFADTVAAPLPNVRVFYIASNDHVWLNRDLASIVTQQTSLGTFVTNQLSGAAWTSVRP